VESRRARSLAHPNVRHGVEQPEDITEPPQHANDHDGIQNRLDGTGHRNELVDHPQNYSDDNQCE
jgi:hypothetical protein